MIETHVCSLEISKKLKSLNVKQNSTFTHVNNTVLGYEGIKLQTQTTAWKIKKKLYDSGVIVYYSAFLASELGEMLPYRLRLDDDDYWLKCSKSRFGYDLRYCKAYNICFGEIVQCETLSNTLGKMLIYLIENKLMEVPK